MKRAEQLEILPKAAKWLVISMIVGVMAGAASAFFLRSLDWVTDWREGHGWIIAWLPVCGGLVGLLYHRYGHRVQQGHDMILDEIHDPKKMIPFRMAPFILISTLATHLFGGSAGREGTAVQMGGAIADQLSRPFGLKPEERKILLMAGISAGFASVFGTPLAGAIFGLEVLVLGRLRYDAILPCFTAAIIGNMAALACGARHQVYASGAIPPASAATLAQAALAGVLFGLVGMLFSNAVHVVTRFTRSRLTYEPARLFTGGVIVAALVWACGTTRYIGLGLPTITESFRTELSPWDWAGKFIFTVLTLGFGFKGGEVTPLFFIGATLGNALSALSTLPAPLLAALGFVAVFAGAANTPLTCIVMGMEIFGADIAVYAAAACVTSYLFSGHAGIYRSQRVGTGKHGASVDSKGAREI